MSANRDSMQSKKTKTIMRYDNASIFETALTNIDEACRHTNLPVGTEIGNAL